MKNAVATDSDSAFVVRRTISIPRLSDESHADIVRRKIEDLTGARQVECDPRRHQIRVQYDAARLGFSQIEESLSESGYPISRNLWSRCKSGLYRFLDENAKSTAAAKGGACCSNPSDIYAKRSKH